MARMPYRLGWHTTREKPSGQHEARWADENGNARGKCFNTKAQAAKYAMNRANNILDASVGLTVIDKDLREAVESFLTRRIKAESNAIYERHLEDFLSTMKEISLTRHLTREVIERYDLHLEKRRKPNGEPAHNAGGRRHIWKSLRTFCNYCIENKWLGASPFAKLTSPKSDFEGRALDPGEYAKMLTVKYPVDEWISRALRIGNPSMIRISQVWKLTAKDFQAPDQLFIEGIKDQPDAWITLHPTALAVVLELLAITPPGERFFRNWKTLDSMRQSFRKKAYRVGLDGVRFHDAGKVTRVTELDAAGKGLGYISALSNTTKTTLAKHYIKADRRKVFADYAAFQGLTDVNLHQTYSGPKTGINRSEQGQQDPIAPTKSKSETGLNISPI